MRPRFPEFRVPVCIALLALVGCNGLNFIWGREENQAVDLGMAPTGSAAANTALRDTIGAHTYRNLPAPNWPWAL